MDNVNRAVVFFALALLAGCSAAPPTPKPTQRITPVPVATIDQRDQATRDFCAAQVAYRDAAAAFEPLAVKGSKATDADPLFAPAAAATDLAEQRLRALPIFEFVEPVVASETVVMGGQRDYLRFLKGNAASRKADLATAASVRAAGLSHLADRLAQPAIATALGMISCPEAP